MNRFREMKRQARRQLHEHLSEPALYLAATTAEPLGCTVRLHLKFDEVGELLRGGFSDRQELTPRILFLGEQVQPARNGIVVTRDMGAWRIDNDLPPDDITITTEVAKLSRNQVLSFGWDPDALYMGLAAEETASNPGFYPSTVLVTKGERGERGPTGKSAFEQWLELPGNEGKTEEDFYEAIGGGTSWDQNNW